MTTLNEDIKRTRENDNTFRVTPLISQVSLQNIYSLYEGKKQKVLVKDCKTSCKLTSFHCDWKEKRQGRRKNGALGVHDVCRAKVGEFFSFLCPLQLIQLLLYI